MYKQNGHNLIQIIDHIDKNSSEIEAYLINNLVNVYTSVNRAINSSFDRDVNYMII